MFLVRRTSTGFCLLRKHGHDASVMKQSKIKKKRDMKQDPYVLVCVDARFHSQQLVNALGGALLSPGLLGSERSALDTKEVKDFFQENDDRQILLQARQAYRQSNYRDVRNELSAAQKARGFFKQKKKKRIRKTECWPEGTQKRFHY